MANSPTKVEPAQVDALLEKINTQLENGTFDRNDNELLKHIVESLADSRGMVRLELTLALGKIGMVATPFLTASLVNHPNPVVRRSCGKALAQIGDASSIPFLVRTLLKDQDTVTKSSAAGALAKMGVQAVPALLQVIAGDHPGTAKGHASWALSLIEAEAIEHLYNAINSPSADVRCAVIGAFANLVSNEEDCQIINLFISSLTDPAANVRVEAAAALGKIGYQPSIPNLINLLNDSDDEVVKAAILALGKIGDHTALEPLKKLADERETVSKIAVLAISQLNKM